MHKVKPRWKSLRAMNKKKLAIVGASGHGKVVADIAECCGWRDIDFFDEAYNTGRLENAKWQVVGSFMDFISTSAVYDGVIVAIGDNKIRKRLCEVILANSSNLVTLIHPAAVVSHYAKIGAGSVIVAGAVVNAYAVLGIGTIVNTCASIDHDCQIGDFVHVSPGAHLAGGVKVGSCSWIGIGSSIKQQVTVGSQVRVGGGAVVINDVLDNLTVVGVPALPLE